MIWMIIGAGVGYIWGVVPACIGFLVGMMVNAIASDQPIAADMNSSNEDPMHNLNDKPLLDDSIDDSSLSTSFVSDGMDFNPANGLPMLGCVDVEGNTYGTDSSNFIEDSSFDMGCDHSFMDNSMDDSFGCGMNDW